MKETTGVRASVRPGFSLHFSVRFAGGQIERLHAVRELRKAVDNARRLVNWLSSITEIRILFAGERDEDF